MENKVLMGNLAQIAEYNSSLSSAIENLNGFTQSFELIKTEKDEYNLLVNGVEIHSSKGAADEAKKIADGIGNINEENSLCILFGLGLGYLFDEIVQRAKGRVILYEPNAEILKCTLEMVEMEEILSRQNVRICANIEDLKIHLNKMSDKLTKISVSFLTSYFNVYEQQIKEIAQIVEYTHGEAAAIYNTISNSGFLTVENTFKNLSKVEKMPFIKTLTDKFKNKPALIVSAGPSLAKNIETIKQNQDKFVIFCVGPALKALLNNGIKPDFATIIEANPTFGQVEGLNLENVNLIFEPYTNPYIFDVKTKNKFFYCSTQNFLNDWLADSLGIQNRDLYSMGTVSYTALMSAKIMGCDPIVLIGQDLAYTDSACYAKGSAYENLECKFDEETQKYTIAPSDYAAYKQALVGDADDSHCQNHLKFLNDNLYTVVGQRGEKLPTQTGYAIFIKHFEKFAQNCHSRTLVNSSIGGAQINGFKNLPLSEVLGESFDKDFTFENVEYNSMQPALKVLLNTAVEAKECHKKIVELTKNVNKEYKRRNAMTPNADKTALKLIELVRDFKRKYFNNAIYFSAYQFFLAYSDFFENNQNRLSWVGAFGVDFLPCMEMVDERLAKIIEFCNEM